MSDLAMPRRRPVPVGVVVGHVPGLLVLEAVVQPAPGYLLAWLGLLLHVLLLVLVRETVVSGGGGSGAAAALLVAEVEPEAGGLFLGDELPGVVGLLETVQPVVHSVSGGVSLRLVDLDLGIEPGLVRVH